MKRAQFRYLAVSRASGILAFSLTLLAGAVVAPRFAAAQANSGRVDFSLKGPKGETLIVADEIEISEVDRRAVAKGNVEITSPEGYLRADTMTAFYTPQRALDWAKGVGNVLVRQKRPDSTMTATGNEGEYHEIKQKANLVGNVKVLYEAASLAEPAVLTGARADIDLATQKAVVTGTPQQQTRSMIKPKGKPGQPGQPGGGPPELITITSNQVEMDGKAQSYLATGNPLMVRGTSQLRAERLFMSMDPQTNDMKEAIAERNVVYDNDDPKQGKMHATGDRGVYVHATGVLTFTGNPAQPARGVQTPTTGGQSYTATAQRFTYNTRTRGISLSK